MDKIKKRIDILNILFKDILDGEFTKGEDHRSIIYKPASEKDAYRFDTIFYVYMDHLTNGRFSQQLGYLYDVCRED